MARPTARRYGQLRVFEQGSGENTFVESAERMLLEPVFFYFIDLGTYGAPHLCFLDGFGETFARRRCPPCQ